jgi:hypothetical protein
MPHKSARVDSRAIVAFESSKKRIVHIASMTAHPNNTWMMQIGRNLIIIP